MSEYKLLALQQSDVGCADEAAGVLHKNTREPLCLEWRRRRQRVRQGRLLRLKVGSKCRCQDLSQQNHIVDERVNQRVVVVVQSSDANLALHGHGDLRVKSGHSPALGHHVVLRGRVVVESWQKRHPRVSVACHGITVQKHCAQKEISSKFATKQCAIIRAVVAQQRALQKSKVVRGRVCTSCWILPAKW